MYSTTSRSYESLAEWKQANKVDGQTLGVDNPDADSSFAPYSDLFDVTTADYKNVESSPALGKMPDGSNAGPYQIGNEFIGSNLSWQTAIPMAPFGLNITR